MKKTKVLYNLGILLLAISFLFSSCKKKDPDTSSDDKIPIDATSAFSMKNFIVSFDQMFVASQRWAWDFTHIYDASDNVTESQQNYKIFGDFGKNMQTVTHNFDSKGIISSSDRVSILYPSDIIAFEYEFDLDGYIEVLSKYYDGSFIGDVNLEYNSEGQLTKKTHIEAPKGVSAIDLLPDFLKDQVPVKTDKGATKAEKVEIFTYNSEGHVATYSVPVQNKLIEYTYTNGNMTLEEKYSGDALDYAQIYEYDSQGRITKMYDSDDPTTYEKLAYGSTILTMESYDEGLLDYKSELEAGMKETKSWSYYYDIGVLEYCRSKEFDDDGRVEKKLYYEGTVENLQLVGYTVIDSRDPLSGKKTLESIYNAAGTKLYYVEFTVSEGSITATDWFTADGTAIDEAGVSEEWVFILVR